MSIKYSLISFVNLFKYNRKKNFEFYIGEKNVLTGAGYKLIVGVFCW
jgi:hypothetical protein